MFASLKRLTKHSVVYGLSLILARSIGFLLLPLHTNVFPKDSFGVVNLGFVYIAFVGIFYGFGFDAAFLRYYLLNDDPGERRKIFSTAFHSIALIAVVLSITGWLAAPALAEWQLGSIDYTYVMQLCTGVLFFDALASLPFLILRAEERSRTFAALKVANVLLNVALNYLFIIVLKHGIAGVFEANLIASLFSFIVLGRLTLRHLGWQFSNSSFKELLAFGLPYVPSLLSVIIIDNVSRMFLEHYAGLATVGLFSAGYRLGMIMSLMVAAFRFAWQPFFLSTSKQADAKVIFSRVLTYFSLVCSVIFLGTSFFIDDLVRFDFGFTILGKEYWQSTVIVPPVLLAYFLLGAYTIFIVGLHIEKKTIYLPLITGIGAGVNIVANLALIPLLGMMGAAFAALLAYLALAASMYIISQRLYPVAYEWSRLAKLALVVAVLFTVNRIFAIPFLARAGMLVAFPGLLWTTGFFERSEIARVKKLFGA
jgi:O-antigen/teichoic acid export membrane protein